MKEKKHLSNVVKKALSNDIVTYVAETEMPAKMVIVTVNDRDYCFTEFGDDSLPLFVGWRSDLGLNPIDEAGNVIADIKDPNVIEDLKELGIGVVSKKALFTNSHKCDEDKPCACKCGKAKTVDKQTADKKACLSEDDDELANIVVYPLFCGSDCGDGGKIRELFGGVIDGKGIEDFFNFLSKLAEKTEVDSAGTAKAKTRTKTRSAKSNK